MFGSVKTLKTIKKSENLQNKITLKDQKRPTGRKNDWKHVDILFLPYFIWSYFLFYAARSPSFVFHSGCEIKVFCTKIKLDWRFCLFVSRFRLKAGCVALIRTVRKEPGTSRVTVNPLVSLSGCRTRTLNNLGPVSENQPLSVAPHQLHSGYSCSREITDHI